VHSLIRFSNIYPLSLTRVFPYYGHNICASFFPDLLPIAVFASAPITIMPLICGLCVKSATLSQQDRYSSSFFPLSGNSADGIVIGVYVIALDLINLVVTDINLVVPHAHPLPL
jgi:hypothetical protein